ncbi:MAG TPA: hypothetical protein VNR18_01275 [Hyphomicrobiales bacterium]|nr:hypothetical protein [Hyphomicrobiales bacterium]
MDPASYKLAWGIYLGAGLIFSVLSWRMLSRYLWRELAYLLQCWLLALIFVPAPVIPDEPVLAPALIVFAMDTLTIEAAAGIGALTRLVMGLAAGLLATLLLSIFYRVNRRRHV